MDCGLLWFLVLSFGQLDLAHGNHTTDGSVRADASNAQPEGPIQALV